MEESAAHPASISGVYANVRISTGEYLTYGLYYAGPNCAGTPMGNGIVGDIGKGVFFSNGHYCRTTGVAPYSYHSYDAYGTGDCSSFTSPISASLPNPQMAYIEEVSRPYDFESIAPLTIKYE